MAKIIVCEVLFFGVCVCFVCVFFTLLFNCENESRVFRRTQKFVTKCKRRENLLQRCRWFRVAKAKVLTIGQSHRMTSSQMMVGLLANNRASEQVASENR